jgi:hypothetical protein
VGKSEGKKPLGSTTRRWKDIIKMYLKNRLGAWIVLIWPFGEYLDLLGNLKIRKNDLAAWS